MYVKEVAMLVPNDEFWGGLPPECDNHISAHSHLAYLVCPDADSAPDLIRVDTEDPQYRQWFVKLFEDEDGLFACPLFPGSNVGHWAFGGAYLLLPLDPQRVKGYGYSFPIQNTAVPLHDFWVEPNEPDECELSDKYEGACLPF